MPNRGIDVNEWIAWRNRCEKYARDFFGAMVYARYELLRRLTREHDCAQVRELIDILDYVRPILQQDRIGLHPATVDELYALFVYQRHCSLVGKWVIAALAIYDEDREALKNFARIALGPGDDLVVRRKKTVFYKR